MVRSQVGIVGQGYVGLSLVNSLCKRGKKVIGVDIDEGRIRKLQNSTSPNESIKDSEISSFIERGLYFPTSSFLELKNCDVVILAVPTPLTKLGFPDYGPLRDACTLVARNLSANALLINESTSHPGTLRDFISPLISKLREDEGLSIQYACSPERVNPGDTQFEHFNTPRVVSGLTDSSKDEVKKFYSEFVKDVFVVSTPEVAEMSKLLENSFRLVNIAFINEISDYCLSRNLPMREVIGAAGTKPFGFMPFYPGPGVGGHCIPVDPAYLLQNATELGQELPILRTSLLANKSRYEKIIKHIDKAIHGVSAKNILLEGVSYKPDVTDTRETPALELFNNLKSRGALVHWHDPLIAEWNGSSSTDVTSNNWDAILVLIKHSNTRVSDLISNSKIIFDFTGQILGLDPKVFPI
jgi:UDP-N-acetyl-D-glucosamine dehydrogenase